MLPSIILNVILFIVAWMFRSKWFKIKVHIDIRNSNTSSILFKQSCLLKITWLNKVIPTKSYSLAVALFSSHKVFNHAQPRWQAKNFFSYFSNLKLFTFTQHMSVSHGHSTICGIEWWLWRRQTKGEDSLTSTRRINGLWRCPLIDINVSE